MDYNNLPQYLKDYKDFLATKSLDELKSIYEYMNI